jgi:hypothetical protein
MLVRMNFKRSVAPAPTYSPRRIWLGNFGSGCVVAGVLLIGAACSTIHPLLLSHGDQDPPHALRVSVCSDNGGNARRITADGGVQFELPDNTYIASRASRDMPPGTMIVVKLKTDDGSLVVWHDDDFSRDLKVAYPVFSIKTGQSDIVTARSGKFGTDRWGYLETGERWRYVVFSSGDAAGYKPTLAEHADALDLVLASACVSRGRNSRIP